MPAVRLVRDGDAADDGEVVFVDGGAALADVLVGLTTAGRWCITGTVVRLVDAVSGRAVERTDELREGHLYVACGDEPGCRHPLSSPAAAQATDAGSTADANIIGS